MATHQITAGELIQCFDCAFNAACPKNGEATGDDKCAVKTIFMAESAVCVEMAKSPLLSIKKFTELTIVDNGDGTYDVEDVV